MGRLKSPYDPSLFLTLESISEYTYLILESTAKCTYVTLVSTSKVYVPNLIVHF